MRDKLLKFSVATTVALGAVLGSVGMAWAQTATPVDLAEDAGTSFRDTGIAVVAILIPLAVAFMLAKKALPWARRMLGI